MKYQFLNLEAFGYTKEGEVERFKVFISDSPSGEMTNSEAVSVTLPPDLRPRLKKLERRSLTMPEAIKVGMELADLLFPPRLRTLLEESRASLKNDGLRIRLRFDGYELADIPWEYMYIPDRDTPVDQRDVRRFLVLNRKISILRDLLLEQPRGELNPVPNQELRMIFLLSNPEGTDELDLENELHIIREALKGLTNIAFNPYPAASIDILRSAVRTEPHIFHFLGHGNFEIQAGSNEGMGSLALTAPDGTEESFSSKQLAMMLSERGVRLAILGACKTSRVDRVNAWTGIAPALIGAGIPAVIGMQFAIEDESAIAFSKSLYEGLAAGQSIDEAIAEGRQAIFSHSDEARLEWGVPVLYMRARDDGVLFPRATHVAGNTLKKVEDELTGKLAGLKTEFQSSLEHFDVVKDYKDLHDNLHDLQFAWFPLVRQKVAGLPDAKGAIYELRSHERDLRAVIGKLKDTLKKNKVDPNEQRWVDELEKARQDFKTGIDSPEPQMGLITTAMERAKQVLETQPTFINGSLMRSVGALRLPRLIGIVQQVFDESIVKDPNKQIVEKFKQGVEELKQINADLTNLMKEHDTWQRNEGKINMIRLMLTNLAAFDVLWAQLKADTSPLYQTNTEEWAGDMRADETALDQASKDKDVDAVIRWFDLFSKDAKERFWNVDKLIKQRCEALVEIRSKMESV